MQVEGRPHPQLYRQVKRTEAQFKIKGPRSTCLGTSLFANRDPADLKHGERGLSKEPSRYVLRSKDSL